MTARHVVLALGTSLALVWLVHVVSAQAAEGRGQTQPRPSNPPAASKPVPRGVLVTRSAPPPYAPTQPWKGKVLPDGQPEIAKGIWVAVTPGTRYIDRAPEGYGHVSRVVDPPDGLIPYQPWALEVKKTQDLDIDNPTKPWHIDPQARCINTVPRLMHYGTDIWVHQGPGVIVYQFTLEHTTRVIPLDGGPHVGSAIKLWVGDARGHWEGNTLVVDTTNLNGKVRMVSAGDFYSSNASLKERMTYLDPSNMVYEVTITDPTVFTRPWTMRLAHKLETPRVVKRGREPEGEIVEYMCHEGEELGGVPSQNPLTRP